MTVSKTRYTLLLLLMLLVMTSLACRLTTRRTQEQNESGAVEETAVTPPANTPTLFSESPEAAEAGDEFESLLDGLLHENDLADDLEDFPEFESTP